MKFHSVRFILLILLSFLFSFPTYAAKGTKAMAVTADPRATTVAYEVLHNGGNAVDAAIAAQWVLNVVEPQSSGLGGGGFFLFYDAKKGSIHTFDGREKAPAEAHPKMFYDEYGDLYPFKPERITGGLPVGVPGTLRLLHEVHGRFGSGNYSFAELFIPAIEFAERGIAVSRRLSRHIDEEKERLQLFESSKAIFLDKEAKALLPNTILFQKDLAQTFRLIQQEGINVFYEGEIARDIVKAVREAPYHPGFINEEDLFYYKVIEREPVHGSYRGYDVFSMGPPSSGATTLIEALHILEGFSMGPEVEKADKIHLLSEAQKLAFQDRNHYLGDPEFTKVPVEKLISKAFAMERGQEIQMDIAIATTQAAVRPLHLEGTHTSHLSIVDPSGNMVAFTTTIESVFGSAMVVPGRGFLLNNELTDFDPIPFNEKEEQVPNAAGGDKRPRSSMTPTFVFKQGRPVLIAGSPGGSTIIGTLFNLIVHLIDERHPLSEAMRAPRVINRGGPIELETALFEDLTLKRNLEKKGHPLIHREVTGNAQAIHFDHARGEIIGQSDPRGEGEALGF